MRALWLQGSLLEKRQVAIRMQEVRFPHDTAQWHCDAWLQIALSLLVYSNAPSDLYQKEFFGQRSPTATLAQAVRTHLGHAPQTEASDGQKGRAIPIIRADRT